MEVTVHFNMDISWITHAILVLIVLLLHVCIAHDHDDDSGGVTKATQFRNSVAPTPVWGDGGFTPTKDATEKEARLFLKMLFEKYGEENLMTFEGFEHLLQSLGIGRVKIDHDFHEHITQDGKWREFHESHNHTDDVDSDLQNENKTHHSEDIHNGHHGHSHDNDEDNGHHGDSHSKHDDHHHDDDDNKMSENGHDKHESEINKDSEQHNEINGSELTYTETMLKLNRTWSYDPVHNTSYYNTDVAKRKKGRRRDRTRKNRRKPKNNNNDETDNFTDDPEWSGKLRHKRAAPETFHKEEGLMRKVSGCSAFYVVC